MGLNSETPAGFAPFASAYEKAGEAEKKLEDGMVQISDTNLKEILTALEDGQWYSSKESGEDFMYARDYSDSIALVRRELAARKKKASGALK